MNKKVLRNLSYGVYAVSALGENRMSGCIANSRLLLPLQL